MTKELSMKELLEKNRLLESRVGELLALNRTLENRVNEFENRLPPVGDGASPLSSDQIYRTIFRLSPGAIIVARFEDGIICDVSDSFCQKTGFSREEAIGKTPAELGLWMGEEREKIIALLLKEGRFGELEVKSRLKDSAIVTTLQTAEVVMIGDQRYIVGTLLDIACRRKMEEAFRESEEKFSRIFRMSPDTMVISRLRDGVYIDVNDEFARQMGYAREEAIGKSALDLGIWVDLSDRQRMAETILKKGELQGEQYRFRCKGGIIKTGEMSARILTIAGEQCLIGMIRDITEKIESQKALRESEEKYRILTEGMKDVVWVLDAETLRFLYISPSVRKLRGYSVEEIMAEPVTGALMPGAAEGLKAQIRLHAAEFLSGQITSDHFFINEVEQPCKDGSTVWTEVITTFYQNAKTGRLELHGVTRDISERKRADEERALLNAILENTSDLVSIALPDGRLIYMNVAGRRTLGWEEDGDIEAHAIDDAHPPWALRIVQEEGISTALKDGVWQGETAIRGRDGGEIPVSQVIVAHCLDGGKIGHISTIMRDLSEVRRAEEDMRAWMRRYDLIVSASGQVAYEYDVASGAIVWGHSMEKVLGYPMQEMQGGFAQWEELLHPDDRSKTLSLLETAEKVCSYWDAEYRMRHKEGKYVWIRDRGFFLPNGDGKATTQLGMLEDITERKRMEEQLLQSQKIESVGRLAGGVAHDFNNMLGVILGYAELALEKADPAQPLHAHLQAIRQAAERSANLIQQLLAFARKQTINPMVLDLNGTIDGMLKLLRRLIGEDIDLAWRPGKALWPVKMDPSQIDQILANLCVNARDAIAGVGKVTIETQNVAFDEAYSAEHPEFSSGEYVLIAVSDNGKGMDKETRKKLFEPFFTTKELGKGTGLGLATVYGIVRQNGGFINVYSEPDQGTTFRIYLPRHSGKGEQAWIENHQENLTKGHETVLVVEDEPALLNLTRSMLEKLGYQVFTARTPGEAIRLAAKSSANIHLLLTDVVMPEMNGKELAANLQSIYPDLKCLFTSGYTANVIAHHGVLDPKVCFVQKPFLRQDLAVKVREALERK